MRNSLRTRLSTTQRESRVSQTCTATRRSVTNLQWLLRFYQLFLIWGSWRNSTTNGDSPSQLTQFVIIIRWWRRKRDHQRAKRGLLETAQSDPIVIGSCKMALLILALSLSNLAHLSLSLVLSPSQKMVMQYFFSFTSYYLIFISFINFVMRARSGGCAALRAACV